MYSKGKLEHLRLEGALRAGGKCSLHTFPGWGKGRLVTRPDRPEQGGRIYKTAI